MKSIIAAAFALALPASEVAAQQATSLQCAGTEPFWSLTVTATAMWFSDHDQKRTDLVLVKPRNSIARLPDQLRVYQTKRARDGAAVTLVVTRNYDSCTDGMSEKDYAYDAVYITPEGIYQGCCSWAK